MRATAIALLLAACGHKPAVHAPADPVRADVERAEEAEKARRHDEARTYYERAVAAAKDPSSAHFAHREFGETLATWGEIEESRTHFEAAVAANPRDPIAWQMLGIIRAKLGDMAGAIAAAERSKQLAPKAYFPRRDLAAYHWKLGEGRDRDPDPAIAAKHRAAALAEYRAILDDIELPERFRDKVKWAIDVLSRPPGAAVAPSS